MSRPRIAAGALVALGSLAGVRAFRHWSARRGLRVDVYYEDGSMISLPATTPEAEAVIARAREALEAAET